MSYYSSIKLVSDYLKTPLQQNIINFEPTYHKIAQSFCKWPIAYSNNGVMCLDAFEWGIITPYMNTPEKIKQYRSKLLNARSEKVYDDNHSVWYSLHANKCLIFCNGFFEHKQVNGKKTPFYISPKEDALFCFAGLYSTAFSKNTFTIITTKANELMAEIHNSGNEKRMPLMLTNELALNWLNTSITDMVSKDILAYSYNDNKMQAWQVAPIRKEKIDNELIIRPVVNQQISIF